MPVDSELAAVLAEAARQPGFHRMSLAEARHAIVQPDELSLPGPALAGVADRMAPTPFGGVPARVYTPLGQGPFPLIVFFHGGGFVLGNLDIDDPTCRELAGGAGCVVLSVDYRLAPEHKFPAATDDGLAVTRWAAGAGVRELDIDPRLIVVAGMSAGANLATVTAMRVRDEGGPRLAGQLLNVPVTDHCVPETASYGLYAQGYMLLREEMLWFWREYLDDASQAALPYAAPLRAKNLAGLPPAYLATAEYDVLRDEGEAYGRRLLQAGVPVTMKRYAGTIHTFGKMTAISPKARQMVADEVAWLNQIFKAV